MSWTSTVYARAEPPAPDGPSYWPSGAACTTLTIFGGRRDLRGPLVACQVEYQQDVRQLDPSLLVSFGPGAAMRAMPATLAKDNSQ